MGHNKINFVSSSVTQTLFQALQDIWVEYDTTIAKYLWTETTYVCTYTDVTYKFG